MKKLSRRFTLVEMLTVVAIISPFSAVISAAVSVLLGQEPLRYNLIIGAVLILAAVLFSDLPTPKRKK